MLERWTRTRHRVSGNPAPTKELGTPDPPRFEDVQSLIVHYHAVLSRGRPCSSSIGADENSTGLTCKTQIGMTLHMSILQQIRGPRGRDGKPSVGDWLIGCSGSRALRRFRKSPRHLRGQDCCAMLSATFNTSPNFPYMVGYTLHDKAQVPEERAQSLSIVRPRVLIDNIASVSS